MIKKCKVSLHFCFFLLPFIMLAQTPNRPFPQHTNYIGSHIQPTQYTQSALDEQVQNQYDLWKNAYLKNNCGTNEYYVEFKPNSSENVSEGLGYGMMITAYMSGYDTGAKSFFDGLYRFYKAHPSNINTKLLAWKQRNCISVEGVNSATDGDIDVAYGLLLAHHQWGSTGTINYLTEAVAMINAIMADDINQNTFSVKLGDWASPSSTTYYNATRPSDFITSHFRAFKVASEDSNWDKVINTCYNLVANMQTNYSATTGLTPDFILDVNTTPKPAYEGFLEGSHDDDYYYNSCRVPWRLGTDYLLYGETRAKTTMDKLTNWLKTSTNNNVDNLSNGYLLDGTKIFQWNDPAFNGAWAVSAMMDAQHQQWLDDLYDAMYNQSFNTLGYYENSLKLLYMLVISSNYWVPEDTGAPTASFTASPITGNAPLLVNLDATVASDPNDLTLTYAWDFGDDTTGTGVTTSHTYRTPGVYTITLVVNNGNQTGTISKAIQVINPNPIRPTIEITSPSEGDSLGRTATNLIATAMDADGSIQSVVFHIDGTDIMATNTTGNTYTASWTPTTGGPAKIVAIAIDNENLSKKDSVNVIVKSPPNTGIMVDFEIASEWAEGICIDVSIHNNTQTIMDGWTLNFDMHPTINDLWNGDWSNDNNSYQVSDIGWNASIPVGGTATFGFCASRSEEWSYPTNVQVNGISINEEACSDSLALNDANLAANTYQAQQNITSEATIQTATQVIFKAGNSITLLPNFHAQSGADFSALIEPCEENLLLPPNLKLMQQQVNVLEIQAPNLAIFPNPFHTATTVQYQLPNPQKISLLVYNNQGNLVQTLVKEKYFQEGIHQFNFQPIQSSGFYLFVLVTEADIVYKKGVPFFNH